jgi:hypothetical protein
MKNKKAIYLGAGLLACMLSACGGDGSGAASPLAVQKAAAPALSTSSPPGSNFNLAPFSLQLPIGSTGSVTTISGANLAAGYTNPYYFYTNSTDGSMVMMDPTQGWATSGSLHPRVELRETAIWSTAGTNKLDATVAVIQVPDHTTIGQIFQGSGPSKPLCELQFTSAGKVQLLLENTNQGGSATIYPITNVPLGSTFNYELSLTGTTITVTVNGTVQTFTMDSSFDGESFYFKAGNYDQTAVSGTPLTTPGTVVQFYALTLTHQ